ncbi:acetyltransferase [Staphylococcus saprophyticus]|uniref:acetyltransferase n=1 Tax=Staphylococcus saprophyticus TaxID=29385 RepID=UPI000254AFE0|nr:acetyltransferase [Staphylococcus saprophyticus]EHY91866.1 hexapeptide transferase family protein [Staphylococcus saprophyticus subsp. saprophyticus KACC 16562]
MKYIILIGNGGHSKVIKDIIDASPNYVIAGYLDNKFSSYEENGKYFYDNLDNMQLYKEDYYFCLAIGNNFIRNKLFEEMQLDKNQFPTLIHPTSSISPSAQIDFGTVVMPNAVINADTKIGKHVIINSGAVIEHDNIIDDYVHISPNATLAGNVVIGECSHIAIGASVLPQIKIGRNCIVGAGATVINEVNDKQIVVGTPAKPKE